MRRECRPPQGPAPTTTGIVDTRDTSSTRRQDLGAARVMREHAVEYARHHWQVGPLCHHDRDTGRIVHPCGKDPVGHLVPHGLLDFADDVNTVTRWWSRIPWNIGVRVPESMFVLDVDGPDRRPHPGRGLQALAELEEHHGPLPKTFTQITGSGGLHLFFRRPPGKLSKAQLPAGLEYKDHGGYVVMAPSIHPDSSQRYVRCDHPVAAPPPWLVNLIVERARVAPPPKPIRPQRFSGPSIADQFTANTSWADILEPHGWTQADRRQDPDADGTRWLHPTATSACSATIKHGCLFVYSRQHPIRCHERGKSPRSHQIQGLRGLGARRGHESGCAGPAGGGVMIDPNNVDPMPEPDGAELLDDIKAFLARFIAYPTEHAVIAHTLWIAHTHLMDCWESTPRIAFLSPEPASGKSRALEVSEPLVPRPVHAVNTTPAYLFRKVSDPEGLPTILYDEIDTVFGEKANGNEDIRGMLNAGHRKGAVAGRCVVRGKIVETEELPAYCAVAMAGLNDLPDTIMTRAVVGPHATPITAGEGGTVAPPNQRTRRR